MANEDQSESAEREVYAHFLKTLGQRIRSLRKERGWTLRDMVVDHGYHLSKWQSFESGRFGMSIPSLLRVARTLGMHPADLMAGIELHDFAIEPGKATETPVKNASKRPTEPTKAL